MLEIDQVQKIQYFTKSLILQNFNLRYLLLCIDTQNMVTFQAGQGVGCLIAWKMQFCVQCTLYSPTHSLSALIRDGNPNPESVIRNLYCGFGLLIFSSSLFVWLFFNLLNGTAVEKPIFQPKNVLRVKNVADINQ